MFWTLIRDTTATYGNRPTSIASQRRGCTQSQSGGRHWLFIHAPGVCNSASERKGLAAGVDVRGEGGYVIHPPSEGYRIISDAPIAHWPDWLLQRALRPAEKPKPAAARTPQRPASQQRLQQIINDALDRVRNAGKGSKHFILRDNSLLLGGIADQAGLSDADLVQRLLDALPASVLDWDNARKTAEWGVESGRWTSRSTFARVPSFNLVTPVGKRLRFWHFGCCGPAFRVRICLPKLHVANDQRSDPLPARVIDATALWAAERLKDQSRAQG